MPRNLDHEREAIDGRLAELIDELGSGHGRIHEAMRYMALAGGKRLRPLLCVLAHESVGGRHESAARDAACAIECVHTYSLIHDDLPCMDDDDLRRGRPSCHRQFDEATAVLTGDALLTLGFEILARLGERHDDIPASTALDTVAVLAAAAGTGGLITGQALDLSARAGSGEIADVRRIHENKTARLFAAAMEIGGVIGEATEAERAALREAGTTAGEAFQIIDDVLDLEMDEETLGKTPGKDVKGEKLTYPSVVGIERARADAVTMVERAVASLPRARGGSADGLARLLESFTTRSA